ncbi:hypothetical protein N9M01_10615 [Luminiphilus sp.]|nr:hypothetical protein [Luminiphilus sp.]
MSEAVTVPAPVVPSSSSVKAAIPDPLVRSHPLLGSITPTVDAKAITRLPTEPELPVIFAVIPTPDSSNCVPDAY